MLLFEACVDMARCAIWIVSDALNQSERAVPQQKGGCIARSVVDKGGCTGNSSACEGSGAAVDQQRSGER